MYACIHGIGSGFLAGVCTPSNATANFRDPPPLPLTIRELILRYTLWLSVRVYAG